MDSIDQQHEIKHFWKCSGALRDAQRLGGSADEIAEWVDELEVLALHTDSHTLRTRCNTIIAQTRTSAASSAGLTTG